MERVGGVPGVTLAPGISGRTLSARPEIQPPLKLLVELEPAFRVFLRNLVDVLRPPVSRRAHDLVGSILARSLFRLRHPLAAVCGITGGPVGCACHGVARVPDVDYAGAATAAQHVRKYPPHLLQARRLVSGVTQQPAAGTPGVRETVRVRASRLDPRDARTRPGGHQSARPQTEGARATQYCGFERCASGDAACGCRRSFAIGPEPRIRLRSLPRRPRSARALRARWVCCKLPASPRPQSLGWFPRSVW